MSVGPSLRPSIRSFVCSTFNFSGFYATIEYNSVNKSEKGLNYTYILTDKKLIKINNNKILEKKYSKLYHFQALFHQFLFVLGPKFEGSISPKGLIRNSIFMPILKALYLRIVMMCFIPGVLFSLTLWHR